MLCGHVMDIMEMVRTLYEDQEDALERGLVPR